VNVVGLWWHDREAIRRAYAYGLARLQPRTTIFSFVVRRAADYRDPAE
jgi:hypothetical protein